ncbi:hypothetical protein [Vibrio parahaemolyticus]|uniref:hypothetical protein n=1 Tax=Vibrio parahaemolyticus TaxID=670 RepID=UPI00193CC51B|nr:hypothetical protein [Vibrio parahaemolyticus]MBM5113327.1 hypothetical protein [Vibrio parahaemolyticus]MCR9833341.1 hypothetical protein [Vibrio parahaemolyticus]MDF4734840.1 hypothetical protein [Vibrio parahaemolyticus]MDG2607765.1 hypothetical protein [Vibrio parahaemolyticus]HCE1838972.1 hypothetical protein [Vibrio parahaemolyticus]
MSVFYYCNIPNHYLNGFKAVRHSLDNLSNILQLAEIVNSCPEHIEGGNKDNFDIAVFTNDFHRFVVRKEDGYFSMSIPFQVIVENGHIHFNCDLIEQPVSGKFISIMRNAIETVDGNIHSHEDVIFSIIENFNVEMQEAIEYYDTFAAIISEDHGYFRFDDDEENADGHIHPRFHFDIFYKNNSSLKIGYDKLAKIDCLISLADKITPKKYLVDHR